MEGGVPFSVLVGFFPGGLPEWGHLSNLGLGSGCFGPCRCVGHASIHMEAMGLWRTPLGPDEPARNFARPGPTTFGNPSCKS